MDQLYRIPRTNKKRACLEEMKNTFVKVALEKIEQVICTSKIHFWYLHNLLSLQVTIYILIKICPIPSWREDIIYFWEYQET